MNRIQWQLNHFNQLQTVQNGIICRIWKEKNDLRWVCTVQNKSDFNFYYADNIRDAKKLVINKLKELENE